jgi:uncharacterized DUF497 family protein
MNLQASGFDWDDGNRSKCQKHGMSIAEIEALFAHGPGVAPDPEHSAAEDRLIAPGKNGLGEAAICGFYDAHQGRSSPYPASDRSIHAREGDSSLCKSG